MGLLLPDVWTWDFWVADDGERYHLFFLRAPHSLGDPDLRHFSARVGHAVSRDLRAWDLLEDALLPGEPPAFDDLATWTGSLVRAGDGTWVTAYTGISRAEGGRHQRIGLATSADLSTWTKHPGSPVLVSDPTWYEDLASSPWDEEHWRDPWLLRDPGGDGWHMLLTARARTGPADDRGVVGHARSPDLVHWQAQPPLSRPGAGFGQLEVPQVEVVEGRPVLLFSCLRDQLSRARRERDGHGGTWCVPADALLGPFDVRRAVRLTDEGSYAGRLVRDRSGAWVLLAFDNVVDAAFRGGTADPVPVRWARDGSRLVLDGTP